MLGKYTRLNGTVFLSMIFVAFSMLFFTSSVKSQEAKSGISLAFLDKEWDGKNVPISGICKARGDGGSISPRIMVSDLPKNGTYLRVVFTDQDFGFSGDHGVLKLFPPKGAKNVVIPSIRPDQKSLPPGFQAVSCTFCNEYPQYADTPFYMAPCSGGKGNSYTAKIYVYDESDKELDVKLINLGNY